MPCNKSLVPEPLKHEEFPKWLNHRTLSPVLVYDSDQEAEHLSLGYVYPGTSDPHAFLVAKATEKMDDAIRTMNADADKKIKAGLVECFEKLSKTIRKEVRGTIKHELRAMGISLEKESLDRVADAVTTSTVDLHKDIVYDNIMETIRQSISRS